ncbi:hypothetical protein X943_003707 [Babesia divergens]|uniref:Glutaredoxin n=1 Tax=Babesia divergens TaxID=32595 RepID=A0AAD9GHX5_BABDI|nr:hypothetical protein X943_003707 [Babesia divergens]
MCTASRGIRSGIYKSAVMPAEVEAKLKDLIRNEKVLLLIKGTPEAPLCGFSATMINILDKYKVTDYAYIDVYSHELIRPCAKKIANWPTFPQLYISGEFIGGCDVTKSLDESGDLAKLLADAARDC